MDLDRHTESDLVFAVLGRLPHDAVECFSEPRVGDVLFGADTDKGDAVGDVERALARNHLTLFSSRTESLGLVSQRFALFGREIQSGQRIAVGALKDVDAIERFFWSGTKLMKICHWVRWTLL